MTTTPVESDHAPYLERCFFFDAVEASYPISKVEGRLPPWLRGSYYVNGPARFMRGAFRYRHWLDGDGMVCALHFGEGPVRSRAGSYGRKLSRRPRERRCTWLRDRVSGDRLRHGLMLEPPVNVSVYPFADTLMAFGEQALPMALDPLTLETIGEYDFHGRLNEVSPFAAHPKLDPLSGHMVNFGLNYRASDPALTLYEFDSGGRLLQRRRHRLTMPHSIHDFGLSRNHAVFFLNPLVIDMGTFLSGASLIDSFSWFPETPGRIFVVPRGDSAETPFSIEVEAGCCLHQINCFETDGQLFVDLLEMDAPIYPQYHPMPDLFANAPLGRPVRFRIDMATRTLVERTSMAYDRTPDFPSIDTRLAGSPYDEFWMLGIASAGLPGRKFFDQLVRIVAPW